MCSASWNDGAARSDYVGTKRVLLLSLPLTPSISVSVYLSHGVWVFYVCLQSSKTTIGALCQEQERANYCGHATNALRQSRPLAVVAARPGRQRQRQWQRRPRRRQWEVAASTSNQDLGHLCAGLSTCVSVCVTQSGCREPCSESASQSQNQREGERAWQARPVSWFVCVYAWLRVSNMRVLAVQLYIWAQEQEGEREAANEAAKKLTCCLCCCYCYGCGWRCCTTTSGMFGIPFSDVTHTPRRWLRPRRRCSLAIASCCCCCVSFGFVCMFVCMYVGWLVGLYARIQMLQR